MREKIEELEKISALLEPSAEERAGARRSAVAYSEDFLRNIEKRKAYDLNPEMGKGLLETVPGEDPVPFGTIISLLDKHVDSQGLNPASGGHLGYIPGGGIYYSSLADYLADVFNRYAGIFYAGPGAVRMENMLIRWMAGIMGYPEDAAGNLTTGGSLANLMAIVTARDAMKISSGKVAGSVIYLSAQTHHSVHKSLRIAGLSESPLRIVPVDEYYRIQTGELERMIREDRRAGKTPFLVAASAGTTDTGAVDPLDEIADVCRRENTWFHVDAAYGGFFILTPEGKDKLKGVEKSDSLVIDPHKGLFLPYGLGTVLVKDRNHLNASHHYLANYMQDTAAAKDELSPADLSPELTKHFRGLRLWLPLLAHGMRPFRACLQEKLMLARYFHSEVKKLGFETGPVPDLSVVIYRFIPASGDADAFNRKLQEAVVKDGRVFISSTTINGKVWLRLACLAFRTHLATIDTLLSILASETRGKG